MQDNKKAWESKTALHAADAPLRGAAARFVRYAMMVAVSPGRGWVVEDPVSHPGGAWMGHPIVLRAAGKAEADSMRE